MDNFSRSTHTTKNCRVEPDSTAPYLMVGWLTKSSADSMGGIIRSMVRNAARLAV